MKLNFRFLVLTMTLALVSACGSKDEGNKTKYTPVPPPGAPPVPGKPGSSPTPSPSPSPSAENQQDQDDEDQNPRRRPDSPTTVGQDDGKQNPQNPTQPSQGGPGNPGQQKPNVPVPPEVDRKLPSAAARDGVREYVLNIVEGMKKDDAAFYKRSVQIASEISDISITVESNTGSSMVEVTQTIKGQKKTLKLFGNLNQKGSAKLVGPNQATVLSGKLICLDKNSKGCNVALVNLDYGKDGKYASVFAISRLTNANFNIKPVDESSGNRDFEHLRTLFENTRRVSGERIRRVAIETVEMIPGDTKVKVSLVTTSIEVFGGMGPFYKPVGNSFRTNSALAKVLPTWELTDAKGNKRSLNVQKTITSMTVVANDEAGQLSVAFQVNSDSVTLNFKRLQPAVIDIKDLEAAAESLR